VVPYVCGDIIQKLNHERVNIYNIVAARHMIITRASCVLKHYTLRVKQLKTVRFCTVMVLDVGKAI
jgi:hypothetical protein